MGIRAIAEAVASSPLFVYERLEPRGKRLRPDHHLFPILHDSANEEMTSFDWRELMQIHLLLWGNAYSEISRDRLGIIKELWPINPDRVRIERDKLTKKLRYRVTIPGGGSVILQPSDMLHIRGFSLNGIIGQGIAQMHREAIGLGLATEEFAARFFGSGASPSGIFEHPAALSETAYKRLRESLEKEHTGVSRAHRIMLLEEGMKWQQVTVDPEKAQFLGLRKFQVTEASRILNVPPNVVGDYERATFTNVEHQDIAYTKHSLRPWFVRIEQRLRHSLLGRKEKRKIIIEFNIDAQLRGDTQSRYQAYATARQWGWMSANDVREKENMNPVVGGDVYHVPLNMIPAGQASVGTAARAGREILVDLLELREAKPRLLESRASIRERQRLRVAYTRLLMDAMQRVTASEVKAVRAAVKKHIGERARADLEGWINDYYAEEYLKLLRSEMLPVQSQYAEAVAEAIGDLDPESRQAFLKDYHTSFAQRRAGSSAGQLRSLLGEEELADVLETRLEEWEAKNPAKVANWEAVQLGEAIASTAFFAGGASTLVWSKIGPDPCEICDALNGMGVGRTGSFIGAGEEFNPEGKLESPLIPKVNIRHPPAHHGCTCMIVPS
jgi:HK97 family phage portal protein